MSKGTADPLLSALDGSIRSLLQAWFSVGFLELRRITFEGSGGALLEKIARYVEGSFCGFCRHNLTISCAAPRFSRLDSGCGHR